LQIQVFVPTVLAESSTVGEAEATRHGVCGSIEWTAATSALTHPSEPPSTRISSKS
jgi:hypothetical protein